MLRWRKHEPRRTTRTTQATGLRSRSSASYCFDTRSGNNFVSSFSRFVSHVWGCKPNSFSWQPAHIAGSRFAFTAYSPSKSGHVTKVLSEGLLPLGNLLGIAPFKITIEKAT